MPATEEFRLLYQTGRVGGGGEGMEGRKEKKNVDVSFSPTVCVGI